MNRFVKVALISIAYLAGCAEYVDGDEELGSSEQAATLVNAFPADPGFQHGGIYLIKSKFSGKQLDAPYYGRSSQANDTVNQFSPHGAENQQWMAVSRPDYQDSSGKIWKTY